MEEVCGAWRRVRVSKHVCQNPVVNVASTIIRGTLLLCTYVRLNWVNKNLPSGKGSCAVHNNGQYSNADKIQRLSVDSHGRQFPLTQHILFIIPFLSYWPCPQLSYTSLETHIWKSTQCFERDFSVNSTGFYSHGLRKDDIFKLEFSNGLNRRRDLLFIIIDQVYFRLIRHQNIVYYINEQLTKIVFICLYLLPL